MSVRIVAAVLVPVAVVVLVVVVTVSGGASGGRSGAKSGDEGLHLEANYFLTRRPGLAIYIIFITEFND